MASFTLAYKNINILNIIFMFTKSCYILNLIPMFTEQFVTVRREENIENSVRWKQNTSNVSDQFCLIYFSFVKFS